ncbi:glycosyl transferase, group 2 family protein [[Synechococcus] sp. NIES-970]|uniref:glycosyltransferase n=1 Tax=Picosynechococcus sp. NKBG15041c TaxID=1407650 RepID=UPI0003FADDD8|nr:glycosyltransferase family 2 protein [Picosynechococcus sp. NKBG15041c]BAW96435.1 glycosyl transferase, group 2 family protein [[Synechococcus] sp. NIES-970]
MAKQPWQTDENHDPLGALWDELTDPEVAEAEFRSDFFQGLGGRRKKSAFMLSLVWAIAFLLHSVSWGATAVFGATGLLFIQAIRLISAKPDLEPMPLSEAQLATAPIVSLIASAKNEEAVIARLVHNLCQLDYPTEKCEVWLIDDASTDRTAQILDQLAMEYPQLKVIHRLPNAGGGKSGALNEVLSQTQGEIIAVFDADATVPPDFLHHVVPMFADETVGAIQVRKAIANEALNFWTKGQATEMILDSYFQQQRIALGGIGELRGNGQFVRRAALDQCGGWNEETITDDLDLTIRLHLDHWKIGFLLNPAVNEEGVTGAIALWHQRSRWAEGGYQRYLDYWRYFSNQRLGFGKKVDLFSFILMQYLLPTAAIPDFVFAILRGHFPILAPLTGLALSLSFWAMLQGNLRVYKNQPWSWQKVFKIVSACGITTVYMLHWMVVMPITTARMSVRPKQLKWVKTTHQGEEENLVSQS